jgi:hypothetical protein
MVKSRAEMIGLVGRRLAEYAEFQHGSPDLPQGDLPDLSEEELEMLELSIERSYQGGSSVFCFPTTCVRSLAVSCSHEVALGADRWPDHTGVRRSGQAALFLGFTMVANHIDFYSALLSHFPDERAVVPGPQP